MASNHMCCTKFKGSIEHQIKFDIFITEYTRIWRTTIGIFFYKVIYYVFVEYITSIDNMMLDTKKITHLLSISYGKRHLIIGRTTHP